MTLLVFETEHLTLRSITAHDAEGLHEAYGDADAMRHWDLPPSRDVSQTAERIRMSAEADPRWHGMWAIQTHAGRLVGAINYHAHNEQQRRLALGWIVVPSCWRQGLMTEAAPPVIAHCFTNRRTCRHGGWRRSSASPRRAHCATGSASRDVAYVFDVYVRRERRHEGHASRAFIFLEEEARRLGLSGIALHVFGRN